MNQRAAFAPRGVRPPRIGRENRGGPIHEDRGSLTTVLTAREDTLAGFHGQRSDHTSCAQAVLGFALRMLGQPLEDTSAACYLHGGLAWSGLTCGALTGAAFALGWQDRGGTRENMPAVAATLQAMVRCFQQKFGSTACLSLVGMDISTDEGLDLSCFLRDRVADKRCIHYVSWVCDRLAQLLPCPDAPPVDDDPRLFWRTDDRCRSAGHGG